MHNKDKVIFDKKLPYEYNICLYILEELCNKGVIDVQSGYHGKNFPGNGFLLYKTTKESICPPCVQSYQLIYVNSSTLDMACLQEYSLYAYKHDHHHKD